MADKRPGFKIMHGLVAQSSIALLGLALGWMVLVGVGCKEKVELPEYPVSELIARYCSFDVGSQWIYVDTAQGLIDTVTVTQHSGKSVDLSDVYGDCTRWVWSDFYESSFFDTRNYSTIYGECQLNDQWVEYCDFGSHLGLFIFTDAALGNSRITFPEVGETYLDTKYLGQSDSFAVRGVIFDDVVTFEARPDYGPDTLVRLHWAPGVGIVKKEQVGRYVWELTGWDVI